jgi:hypothetical protein
MTDDLVLPFEVVLNLAALIYLLDLPEIPHGIIWVAAEDLTIDKSVGLGPFSAFHPKLFV